MRDKEGMVKEKKQFLEGEIENNTEKERTLNADIRRVICTSCCNAVMYQIIMFTGGKV